MNVNDTEDSVLPSYLTAGNSHTVLNTVENDSWLEQAQDVASSIPKFIGLSLASGVNEIYNILPTVGNMFGGDYEQSNFKVKLQEYDDDLSKYYTDHQLGIDAVGFVLGSFAPGLGGIKVLNAGQTVLRGAIDSAAFGKNMGSALGMLAPQKAKYLDAAMKEIRVSGNPFHALESNTLKALATDVQINVLESAAFETAVLATMHNSPILKDMDAKDLTWNFLIGTGLGGAIGGTIGGLFTTGAIKRAGLAADREILPWAAVGDPAANALPSDRFLFRANQLETMPAVPQGTDLTPRITKTAEATRSRLLNEMRGDLQKLTGEDGAVAEAMFTGYKLAGFQKSLGNLIDTTAVGRASSRTGVESELIRLETKLKTTGWDSLTTEEVDTWARTRINWMDPKTGEVFSERPSLLGWTDKISGKDTIALTPRGVRIGNTVVEQENNVYRPFNITGLSHLQVEARQWWAELLPRWVDDTTKSTTAQYTVHASDIPLLKKAYKDGLERLHIIPDGESAGTVIQLNSRQEILDAIKMQTHTVAERLAKGDIPVTDVNVIVDKLRAAFGISFNIIDDASGTYNAFWKRAFERKALIPGGKTADITGETIGMEKAKMLARTIAASARTLKHEEGHSIFQVLLDARGIAKGNLEAALPKLYDELVAISKRARPDLWKSLKKSGDAGLKTYLHSHHELFADAFSFLSLNSKSLAKYPEFSAFAGHLVREVPESTINQIAARAIKPSQQEIAKVLDVDPRLLSGEIKEEYYFARDTARSQYRDAMKVAGVRESDQISDPLMLPNYVKMISKEQRTVGVDGNLANGMAGVAARARLYEDSATRVSTSILREELPDISLQDLFNNLSGGQKFLGFENSNYGSAGSVFSYVGQRTHNLIKKFREATSERFTPLLHKLGNDVDAAMEWSVLNERLRSLPQVYGLSEDGAAFVIKGSDAQVAARIAQGLPAEIPIRSPLVQSLAAEHITANGQRLANYRLMRANEGFGDARRGDLFYPLPRNPKDTPFFAFVIDDTITNPGHSSMIYAASAKELDALKNEILTKTPELKVLTKVESEAYFKARGQYEFDRTLNQNHINELLSRRGVSASYLPTTDPSKLVQDFLEWHLQRDSTLVREAVSHRYGRQFDALRTHAAGATAAAKSRFGYVSPLAHAESGVDDPAMNLIRMALDVQQTSAYPYWHSFGQMLDGATSKMWSNVSKLWDTAVHPNDLEKINSSLQSAGYNGPVVDEALYNVMNTKVPRGTLSTAVNKLNGLIATFALRLDPLNALNNTVGSNVLLGTETQAVLKAIRGGNKDLVGELARISEIRVPGTDAAMLSPTKLIGNAMSRYHNKVDREFYKQHGFISSITDQYDQTLDILAIRATDSAADLDSKVGAAFTKMKQWGDKGEALTGNRVAEEFNRFVAADVMKQITDIAVRGGLMDTRTQLSYINTFVNRTQGNYLASQRPMLFQGPVGQAIGLFQTYQFNLIQQMLRHITDSNGKSVATMMMLQGGIYGMNGLPAFNAINTHLVGGAPGNRNHTDLYQAAYSAGGKEGGDWLMYGALSNVGGIFHPDLKNNMYSRGDVNPRHLTIVPTSLADVPVVNATAKFFGNLSDMFKQTAAGGDVFGTMMRGLEHNGVSRPLTGLALVLEGAARPDRQVISTSNKDNILMAHDLLSLSSLTRLAGGKPMDEAITQDALFRINSYKQKDMAKRETLASAIKVSTLSGNAPDQEQVDSFANTYAASGGKQDEFAQFMVKQYRNVQKSQAEKLRDKLSSPYSIQLQRIMGGNDE
jgi:hypothetical protein